MKKVNFNVTLKGLDGNELLGEDRQPIILGKFLANIIARQEAKESPMEKYELCHKLFTSEKEVELKDSEKLYIKNAVESGGMTVLVAAQILKLINA